jgi:hypothetical protein
MGFILYFSQENFHKMNKEEHMGFVQLLDGVAVKERRN